MKRLLLILILTLSIQSWTKADDIRDFQIEGMSIRDSALDYFSKSKIIKGKQNYYKNKKVSVSWIPTDSEQYTGVQFHWWKKDNQTVSEKTGY